MVSRAPPTEARSGRSTANRGSKDRRTRRVLLAVLAGVAVLVVLTVGAAWIWGPRPSDPVGLVRTDLRAAGSAVVPLSRVALQLREAVIATEDERFYRHHGIDVIGLLRATAFDVSHATLSQGASTITEQLAKILYLGGDDHSPWRKLEDMVLAVRLEGSLSKDQILELYVNRVSFGPGAVGIRAASERYFGVQPSVLDLAQASLLAGLVQAPSADDPFVDPAAARARQAEVLTSMIKDGYTTPTAARSVLADPLPLASGPPVPRQPGLPLTIAPQWSVPEAAAGAALLMAAVGLRVAARRRPALAVRLGSIATSVAGLLLVARAIRAD